MVEDKVTPLNVHISFINTSIHYQYKIKNLT